MKALPSISRRWLALAALATAVLVVPTASAGSAASIKGVGAGETDLGFTEFELSAHAEDDPTTPETGFGQVKIERATGTLRIDVRCTRVAFFFDGVPHAFITGVVVRSSDPLIAPGRTWYVAVMDGGEPGSAAPVDRFQDTPFNGDPNTFCQVSLIGPPNVIQGNIVVKV
jgi:hypothetical protein